MTFRNLLIFIIGLYLLTSCATGQKGRVFQSGMASWYGEKFHGRQTASGEVYDMYALTAAHPKLPFGTMVYVKSKSSGNSVVVRVNDRGPFARNRIIDLSYAAAKKLGIIKIGEDEVEISLQ